MEQTKKQREQRSGVSKKKKINFLIKMCKTKLNKNIAINIVGKKAK